MAGIEVMDLHCPVQTLPEAEPARDSAEVIKATTPVPPPPATIVGDAEKARRTDEVKATRALAHDPENLKK